MIEIFKENGEYHRVPYRKYGFDVPNELWKQYVINRTLYDRQLHLPFSKRIKVFDRIMTLRNKIKKYE